VGALHTHRQIECVLQFTPPRVVVVLSGFLRPQTEREKKKGCLMHVRFFFEVQLWSYFHFFSNFVILHSFIRKSS
jgi:hypothetical protein